MKEAGRVVTRRADFKAIDVMADRAWLHWTFNVATLTPNVPRHIYADWNKFSVWLDENWGVKDEANTPTAPCWEITDPKKYSMFVLRWSQ